MRLARACTGRDRRALSAATTAGTTGTSATTTRGRGVPDAVRGAHRRLRLQRPRLARRGPRATGRRHRRGDPRAARDRGARRRASSRPCCERAHGAGALVVFDEIITGFRLAPGGAQERYGVTRRPRHLRQGAGQRHADLGARGTRATSWTCSRTSSSPAPTAARRSRSPRRARSSTRLDADAFAQLYARASGCGPASRTRSREPASATG